MHADRGGADLRHAWAACQELNVAVGSHETTGSRIRAAGADRFKSLGITHISTHSVEQMLACMDVIMGGVMERFPRLRFALLGPQALTAVPALTHALNDEAPHVRQAAASALKRIQGA